MPFLGDAALPDGLRVYAIGDVHGCLGKLERLLADIESDLNTRAPSDHRIIYCGDYVDRGPDTSGVIELLIRTTKDDDRVTCLYGNHEDEFLGFLSDPRYWADVWLQYGGVETLASYGVNASDFLGLSADLDALRDAFEAALPAEHAAFLEGLPRSAHLGDFFFAHAGIRPGVELDAQDDNDLIWIRSEFLFDERDHGAVIVHGHTPHRAVEVKRNRINIDTGAVFGRDLTCLVIEGTDIRFLEA